jgi:hypothetical protein
MNTRKIVIRSVLRAVGEGRLKRTKYAWRAYFRNWLQLHQRLLELRTAETREMTAKDR